jgi:hypothetical protein
MNTVVMIDVGGKPSARCPRTSQFHPVTDRPLHVDFLRIGEHTKVTSTCRCTSSTKKPRPASSAAACSTSCVTSSSWSATRPRSPTRSHLAGRLRRWRFDPHLGVKLPKGVESAITDRDFTIATIVAPSALKSSEGDSRSRGCGRAAKRNRYATPVSRHPQSRGGRPLSANGQSAMQIWVGLGNPGAQYAMHRHNVGFMAIDTIAERPRLSPVEEAVSGLDAPAASASSASCCSSPPPS